MAIIHDFSPKYQNLLRGRHFTYKHLSAYNEPVRVTKRVLGDHVNKSSSTRYRLRSAQTQIESSQIECTPHSSPQSPYGW